MTDYVQAVAEELRKRSDRAQERADAFRDRPQGGAKHRAAQARGRAAGLLEAARLLEEFSERDDG